ncbi:DMT family transporter [Marinomonas algicola]|uniref:DMT family transporter n=1 Tax=Marinomonas algicola TaxID=2773454 RepID=UPI001EFF4604|nr:DMT family transporter [Marinomonas algicola]
MILNNKVIKLVLGTVLALVAFAANSIFCRLALGAGVIDASGFTLIRLFSGTITLIILWLLLNKSTKKTESYRTLMQFGSWKGAFYLFIYALSFSYAYLTLETGLGALILFAAVQITMILTNILMGGRLSRSEWCGVIIAFSGFVYLVSPTITSPSLEGFLLMTASGVAWGFYSMNGKSSKKPLEDTLGNFVRTLPALIFLFVATFDALSLTVTGVIFALASGVLASGLGYAIWYSILPLLKGTTPAVLQLLVPVLAAIGGVFFVGEAFSLHVLLSSSFILGGVLMVLFSKKIV